LCRTGIANAESGAGDRFAQTRFTAPPASAAGAHHALD
jgi:hypothetical protein